MKHEPPVPEANRSPYPIKEAPHTAAEPAPPGVQVTADHRPAAHKDADRRSEARQSGEISGRTIFGIGAATALGALAAVAALMLTRSTAKNPRASKATAESKSKSKSSGKRAKNSA